MKLLTKNQIQEHKSKERQADIEQGLRFARKVDETRSILDREKKELDVFRDETLPAIKKQVSDAIAERDELLLEVSGLNEKRIELLRPLDEEWSEVKTRSDSLNQLEKRLKELSSMLESREIYIDEKSKEVDSLTAQAEQNLKYSKSVYEGVLQDRDEAKRALNDAYIGRDSIVSELNNRTSHIESREMSMNARETTLDLRKQGLDSRERNLMEREIQVEDRYQTLLRTIERLK